MRIDTRSYDPALLEAPATPLGMFCGFVRLDRSNFICVAARPGMGKTSFSLYMALEFAKKSKKAAYILSLDLTAEEVYQRLICTLVGVDALHIRQGTLNETERVKVQQGIEQLKELDILIDDQRASCCREIEERVSSIPNLGMLVIDDGRSLLPLLDDTDVPHQLRRIAERRCIPVIFGCTLPRALEKRRNKRPRLIDLSKVTAMQNEADTILFLYREGYYNPRSKGDMTDIILAKNSFGATATIAIPWHRLSGTFYRGEG